MLYIGLGRVPFYNEYWPAFWLCFRFWNEEESLHNLEKNEEPDIAENMNLRCGAEGDRQRSGEESQAFLPSVSPGGSEGGCMASVNQVLRP